ncbi:hypothetical protein LMF89_14345 [Pelosinus sp. Bkl1]|uniref:Uncharacterized protein n=1 Tax=Pelosinus baikalensis TaxID=2892015 RepID=A0ABS8HUA9_9FIRM|nr:hypothetical protein [Pelosinus baikalensis]
MVREAIIRIRYDEFSALLSSIKYDQEDVKPFLAQVNPSIRENHCINHAIASNLKFFRRPEIKRKINQLVEEPINRKKMTRQEYLLL